MSIDVGDISVSLGATSFAYSGSDFVVMDSFSISLFYIVYRSDLVAVMVIASFCVV